MESKTGLAAGPWDETAPGLLDYVLRPEMVSGLSQQLLSEGQQKRIRNRW